MVMVTSSTVTSVKQTSFLVSVTHRDFVHCFRAPNPRDLPELLVISLRWCCDGLLKLLLRDFRGATRNHAKPCQRCGDRNRAEPCHVRPISKPCHVGLCRLQIFHAVSCRIFHHAFISMPNCTMPTSTTKPCRHGSGASLLSWWNYI